MRIVRFTEDKSEGSQGSMQARWGILEGNNIRPVANAPYASHDPRHQEEDSLLSLESVVLQAPVQPSKLICVGRNYAEHAAEFGNEAPPEPLIFLKPPSALLGPDQPIVHPFLSERVDHEGELAVVIGRRARKLDESEVQEVIFGYTIANDVTARDLQRSDGQWTRGKGFDTFAPVGPWVDTDYDPRDKMIRCSVNGELRQESSTKLLIHSIERIISYVTAFMTVEPGDIILTGTPAGVGPMKPGDVVTVEIEGLGELSNPIADDQ